jgi:nucleoside-diphosphate-sugar epimerase
VAILITGGTGFLGNHLLHNLLGENKTIFLLVRRESYKKVELLYRKNSKVKIVIGDISLPQVLEREDELKKVCEEVSVILHAAAYSNIRGEYDKCFLQNVVGTTNVLHLSKKIKNLEFFHYVSSIAVSGDFKGELKEDVLDIGQKFTNHYAQTKFDAELLVRNWNASSVQKRIYRLGVLIGDSNQGMTPQTDGPYYFFELLKKLKRKKFLLNALKYLPMPFEKSSIIPMIPVDHAAKFVAKGVIDPKRGQGTRCYHVLSQHCPTVGQFVQDSFDEFGFSVNVVPLPKTKANNVIMDKVGLPKELLPYTYSKCKYDRSVATKDFPGQEISSYGRYKNAMFSFVKNQSSRKRG